MRLLSLLYESEAGLTSTSNLSIPPLMRGERPPRESKSSCATFLHNKYFVWKLLLSLILLKKTHRNKIWIWIYTYFKNQKHALNTTFGPNITRSLIQVSPKSSQKKWFASTQKTYRRFLCEISWDLITEINQINKIWKLKIFIKIFYSQIFLIKIFQRSFEIFEEMYEDLYMKCKSYKNVCEFLYKKCKSSSVNFS